MVLFSALAAGCGDSASEEQTTTRESAAATAFSLKVNFQPATATLPAGYMLDSGAVYANRGNGFTYGWNADATSFTRDRNSSRSPDQRYDTLIYTQQLGARQWELAVPNGNYSVRVVCGDASRTDSTDKVNVEGALTVSGSPTSSNRWVEGTRTVAVTDGKLTISNASGSNNNKLNFVEIASVGDTGTGGSSGAGGSSGTTGTGGTAGIGSTGGRGGTGGSGSTGGTTATGGSGSTGGTGGSTGGSGSTGGTTTTGGSGSTGGTTGGTTATGGSGAISGGAGTGSAGASPTRSAGCGKAAPQTGDFHLQTTDGAGNSRDYEVLVPASYNPSTPLALTFVYHGAGGNQANSKAMGLQNASGAASSSIFVFPQGINFQSYGIGWNDTCGGYDMVFSDRMANYLSDNYCVDPTRIFAAGFSWGCDQVTALSCCRGPRFRAIAPAACTDEFRNSADYRTYNNSPCATSGTTAVRFTYDSNGDPGYTQQQFQSTVSLFRSFNSCGTSSVPSGNACVSYAGCTKPFLDCRYPGMGHTVPQDYASATWSFFSSFR